MSYTPEQVAALRAAIATGATRVRMNGEEVQYRSLGEMERILALAEASLGGSAARRPTHFHPTFDRGV
ncbi:phage head-tail joining protein [Rhodobacter capsulatus]|uniref:phage head-tail joining protein n=1 Tax=Rhodobacter capsulatus TaxID=1061 RepID=UPI004024E956